MRVRAGWNGQPPRPRGEPRTAPVGGDHLWYGTASERTGEDDAPRRHRRGCRAFHRRDRGSEPSPNCASPRYLSMPAHIASGGKALLADLKATALRSLYPDDGMPLGTSQPVGTHVAFTRELEQIRARHGGLIRHGTGPRGAAGSTHLTLAGSTSRVGPWDSVETAWRSYQRAQQPDRSGLGMTIAADNVQYVWRDDPASSDQWPLPSG